MPADPEAAQGGHGHGDHHSHSHSGSGGLTDSAGTPWAGRHFEEREPSSDDGSAPEVLAQALAGFLAGETGEAAVVDAARECRLLVPLIANLGASGVSEHGGLFDKRAELSIVTVAGPDGRDVLPVFTAVDAMQRWNPKARPVPAEGIRVAVAAASEHTDLVVIDPTSPTEFAIRRPALWAMAQSLPWTPSYLDPEVLAAFVASAQPEPAVLAVQIAPGDPTARLTGPELAVHLVLTDGLAPSQLDAVLTRLQQRWSMSEVIADRVDSLGVHLSPAGPPVS
jgi:hypothetical protein